MLNRLFILTIFVLAGCGKEVSIPTDLERVSSITQADSKEVILEGTLTKGNPSSVKIGDKTYKVSRFSSYSALEYISTLQEEDTVVKFKGEIKTTEVVINKFY